MKIKIINSCLQLQYTKSKLVSSEVLYGYGRIFWSEQLVRLHDQVDAARLSFGSGLTVLIRGGLRVELIQWWLRQKSTNKSRTSSSCPTASAWTDTTNDTPPTPDPPSGKFDDISKGGCYRRGGRYSEDCEIFLSFVVYVETFSFNHTGL